MKEGSEGRDRLVTEASHTQREVQGRKTVCSSAVWRDLNLCKTYRGLVSEENLRHSSRRIEKGTAKFQEAARTSSDFLLHTESTIFEQEGCLKNWGPKTANNFVREKLVLHYQGTTFKSRSDFFEVDNNQAIWTTSSKHYSGFLDSRTFENITEYFDSHISQNLKRTRFILGKKATSY